MSEAIIFNLFTENDHLANKIATSLSIAKGKFVLRTFPDQETYFKFEESVANKEIIFIASLNKPNEKILPLVFAAETAKELGAKRVGLIAPYLAYMRQDIRFQPGECITSKYYAKLISNSFDWLITIDPHLHRYRHLNEIYSISIQTLHATTQIAKWIKENVTNPVLIGPDSESKQWIEKVAFNENIPYLILEKTRHGDKQVEIQAPLLKQNSHCTPVLIDDIISTACTMIETVRQLNKLCKNSPVCIGVHGVFAEDAYQKLLHENIQQIVTCNTIYHVSNKIDISTLLIAALSKQLAIKIT
ncbi:MAG: phosphoribosylpyrophosphate synthetase [Gammaproteobacteria bacterium RIFCSPHIGHO2_12_FULL_35_23]|nr:MAG: phosphoribosylpyrophosphate synthetase [Gammaproteobacteria bacterium RIFCSPHIGHO2_12_FULL_35_23]